MTQEPPPPPAGGHPPQPPEGGFPPPQPPGGFPPPASGYPPPPPPAGGYPPPPPPQSGGQPPIGYVAPPPPTNTGGLPTEAYTPWISRVAAYVIDAIPAFVILGIALIINLATRETVCVSDISDLDLEEFCVTGTSSVGQLALVFGMLAVLAYWIWNLGYRQGTTGSSVGKTVLKFKVVSENTGQPIGFGMSVVRQLAHIVDNVICYVGYLFPLWDSKRQTLADKIVSTVCLPTSS